NIITETDLVRRLWLDNYFYGTIFSAHYNRNKNNLIIGGSLTQYDGEHYGKIIKAAVQAAVPANHIWYLNPAEKSNASLYIKWTRSFNKNWQSYVDLQGKKVQYSINGFRDNPAIKIKENYHF